jgi:predicted PurR-regulated permease PerM
MRFNIFYRCRGMPRQICFCVLLPVGRNHKRLVTSEWKKRCKKRKVINIVRAIDDSITQNKTSYATKKDSSRGEMDETALSFFINLRPKRLFIWLGMTTCLWYLRPFFGVLFGTFVLSYVANSFVSWSQKITKNRLPRRWAVLFFYAIIVSVITSFSLLTVPRVIKEGQYFIRTIESANPYVFIADSIRNSLGDDLSSKLESLLIGPSQLPFSSVEQEKLLPHQPSSLSGEESFLEKKTPTDGNKKGDKSSDSQKWTEERSTRLGILLQKSVKHHVAAAVSLTTKILRESTKILFKALVSLVFSFLIVWDLPKIARAIGSLKRSKIGPAFMEVAPHVGEFGAIFGKSFEAQLIIALSNTTLTGLGLMFLRIPGVGFLSFIVLICSFIPVVGVFISTFPMLVVAISEYGIQKMASVISMVVIVHLIEAYVLNPQIYSVHLKLHPLLVLIVLYIAEHIAGVSGLILGVPILVYLLRWLDCHGEEEKEARKAE